MRKMNKRILSLMLCLVCALALLPARSAAVSAVDTGRETALTVSYTDAGAPVSGVPFEIYYVAAAGADGTFTLSGDFKDYPVMAVSPLFLHQKVKEFFHETIDFTQKTTGNASSRIKTYSTE